MCRGYIVFNSRTIADLVISNNVPLRYVRGVTYQNVQKYVNGVGILKIT
jgi:hypothetical protein